MSSSFKPLKNSYRNNSENNNLNGFYKTSVPSSGSSIILTISLWIILSIFNTTKISMQTYFSGYIVEISLKEAFLVLLATYSLYKSLETRNFVLVMPWLCMSIFTMYFSHYMTLVKIAPVLKNPRLVNGFAVWTAFVLFTIALGVRIILVLKVIYAIAKMWYRKKLENELF